MVNETQKFNAALTGLFSNRYPDSNQKYFKNFIDILLGQCYQVRQCGF